MSPQVAPPPSAWGRRFVFVVSSGASVPFVVPLKAELEGRGHSVVIFSGKDELGTSAAREGRDHRTVAVLDRRATLPSPARLLAFRRLIWELKPDVVIPATPKAMLVTALAVVRLRTSLLLWYWGLPSESAAGASRFVLEQVDRFALSVCDAAWFNSESLLAATGAKYPKMSQQMLYNPPGTTHGISRRFFSAQPVEHTTDGPLTIGFVGRLAGDKGIDGLVRSFVEHVEQAGVAHELRLVGPIDDRDPVSLHTLNTIAAHPSIRWSGPVKDVLPRYLELDVLAFPSRREGFPNAPLEAAAVGVPTVAFDATGTRDAVGPSNGFIVAQGDWGAFWTAVDGLVDPVVRQRVGYTARSHVERELDQQRVVSSHADFLEGWLADHR